MEIFDVFSMNGIENYLKVSQTHISKDFYLKGGIRFSRGGGGGNAPLGGGAVKYPECNRIV